MDPSGSLFLLTHYSNTLQGSEWFWLCRSKASMWMKISFSCDPEVAYGTKAFRNRCIQSRRSYCAWEHSQGCLQVIWRCVITVSRTVASCFPALHVVASAIYWSSGTFWAAEKGSIGPTAPNIFGQLTTRITLGTVLGNVRSSSATYEGRWGALWHYPCGEQHLNTAIAPSAYGQLKRLNQRPPIPVDCCSSTYQGRWVA